MSRCTEEIWTIAFLFSKGEFSEAEDRRDKKNKNNKKKTTVPSRILPRQNDAERQESLRPARCSVVSPLFGFSLFPIIIFVFLCAVWRFSSCVFIFVRVSSPRVCLCVCVFKWKSLPTAARAKKKQQLSSRLSNDSPRALAPVLVSCAQEAKSRGSSRPSALAWLYIYTTIITLS